MNERAHPFGEESEKLAHSWQRHESAWLRDYLVSGVEDPRLNVQSILSRHFLLTALTGAEFRELMSAEYRFAAAMNWLAALEPRLASDADLQALRHALRHGADDAEGFAIPRFLLPLYTRLPESASGLTVPNYLEEWLAESRFNAAGLAPADNGLNLFLKLWNQALARWAGKPPERAPGKLRVLEAACGSANDYRFVAIAGLARFLDYSGIDISDKNIANARALFPGIDFQVENVFSLTAADGAFELTFVHDLFEHLSPAGLEQAAKELCRVTRGGLCVGFFNMEDIPEHVIRPVEEYHWNTLSLPRMRELFARLGFDAQVVHIGTFLREETGCGETHNPNACTFLLSRAS